MSYSVTVTVNLEDSEYDTTPRTVTVLPAWIDAIAGTANWTSLVMVISKVEDKTSRERPKTVGQLMEELAQYPKDMRIMVHGYEGGYHDAPSPITKRVDLNVHDEWYDGPHDDSEDGRGLEVVVL